MGDSIQVSMVTNGTISSLVIPPDTSIPPMPEIEPVEIVILIIVGSVAMITNIGLILLIIVFNSYRRAANAFLCHQCILEFLKAGYCLPFAQTLTTLQSSTYCGLLGSSYIVFVTTSALNMLALVMNEAYLFSDLTLGIKDSRNYCCVVFGIFIIWFASIIMNLGVAFIPGNPSFDREMGHCIFVYGITRNYVLHILWIVLISMAIGMTIMYLKKLHTDIKRLSYYRLSSLVRATIDIDPTVVTPHQRQRSESMQKTHVNYLQALARRKLLILVLMLMFFILFWYPLFILTIVDPHFHVRPQVYKSLTMYAWSNPLLSPFILFFLIKPTACFPRTLTEGPPPTPEFVYEEEYQDRHQSSSFSRKFKDGNSVTVTPSQNYYCDDRGPPIHASWT